MHAMKTNEMIQLDYCFMEAGDQGHKYVLIFKDHLSGYVMLSPPFDADAETTSRVLIEWCTTFGLIHTWISDQGRHIKNEVLCEINDKLHAHHHLTLQYCPWAKESMEVVYRELLLAKRELLSEL